MGMVAEEQAVTARPRIVFRKRRRVLPLELVFLRPLPAWKRAIDIVGSVLGLIISSPVMVLAAVAVKLTSPGPVIFKQERAGVGGKRFIFYKFRSMVDGADALKKFLLDQNEQSGPAFKMRNDPRMTRVGRFLRSTSIDELPQLWNVLKGNMSLVGPRPPTLDEVPRYAPWQRERLEVTPGITGIWQISGRSNVKFENWVRMDIQYIRRRSLLLDLQILWGTAQAVFLRRGAH